MLSFIVNSIFWTLAIYGAFEIVRTIINIYMNGKIKSNGIHIIIAVKNEEKNIEGFLRNFLFRIIYGKEEDINNILVVDLGSEDETVNILNNLKKEYECIKITDWNQCKEIIENMNCEEENINYSKEKL